MNEVWRAYLSRSKPDTVSPEFIAILSPTEKARLDGLKQAQRQKQYLLSRAMIRVAFSRHYNLPLSHWLLEENQNAPPTVVNTPDKPCFLSLSHSADCILLAISEQAVGLDVEQISTDRPHQKIAERVFTPKQCKTLRRLPQDEAILYFYHLWTSKESLVKLAKPKIKTTMFSTTPWETHNYFSGHAQFGDYYASILSVENIRVFCSYDLSSFEQHKKITLF